MSFSFQGTHEPDLVIEALRSLRLNIGYGLALQIVVPEHQVGHLVGHLGESGVAAFDAEALLGDGRIQQDLDVHLVVRAVDTRRVINGIGIQPTTGQPVFDAPKLGDTEVGTLAHDPAPQF